MSAQGFIDFFSLRDSNHIKLSSCKSKVKILFEILITAIIILKEG